MRIAVDARHLPEGRGVARYTQRTLEALGRLFPGDELVAVVPGRDPIAAVPGVELVRTALPGRVIFGAGRPTLERLAGGGLDAVWMPAPAPIGLNGSAPLVLTVHDLSFEERPQDFTAYERAWHRAGRLDRLARRAARVIAVSAATREVAVRRWELDAQRVDVVLEGAGAGAAASEGAAGGANLPLGRAYVLVIGALEPRKAPELVAGAFARARAAGLEADLVFAGAGRLAPRLTGQSGVHVLGAVAPTELDALLRGALALVSASWSEGFGLTPLEALAAGVPPIVSDLPVYDETLATGALRFPPGDGAALAAALLRVAGEPGLRGQLVSEGRAAIAPLTWDACARGVHASIERAVAGP
ncbi:MAG: glycosyltransferase family 4 protein [Solirubrobacterales bacterium]|nr:glycosyltransferase family 4 protein [Solirubrobacterales bacterium]